MSSNRTLQLKNGVELSAANRSETGEELQGFRLQLRSWMSGPEHFCFSSRLIPPVPLRAGRDYLEVAWIRDISGSGEYRFRLSMKKASELRRKSEVLFKGPIQRGASKTNKETFS